MAQVLNIPPNASQILSAASSSNGFVAPEWATWFQQVYDSLSQIVIPGGGVTSVTGTAGRITSTGGTTPVIDIDAAYVGQASITTLGTITTGVWHGTPITSAYIDSDITVKGLGCNKGDGITALSTGFAGAITIPYSGTVGKWYIVAEDGGSGSCVVDVKRNGVSIVGGGNKPTLTAQNANNATPSGWTSTTLNIGDIISFNVDSASSVKFVNVVLAVTAT